MKRLQILLILGMLLLSVVQLQAVPISLNHQGQLLDNGGQPVNGTKNMLFEILEGSTVRYNSGTVMVAVSGGLFNVLIGGSGQTSLDSDLFKTAGLKLRVSVDGIALSPDVALAYAPYAANAEKVKTVDGASGGTINSNVNIVGDIKAETTRTKNLVLESATSTGDRAFFIDETGVIRAGVGPGCPPPVSIYPLNNQLARGGEVCASHNIEFNGNVGIGTANPEAKLHVKNVDPGAVTFISECSATQTEPNALFTTAAGGALNQQGNTVMAVSSHVSVGFQATCQITPGADDMAGLIVRENSASSPTADVMSVENNSGSTKFLHVDNSGVVHWAGTAQGSISGNAATATNASQLGGQPASSYCQLQSTTPGTPQTGHINITGTMTSNKVVSNGGTFTSTFAVQPLFVFVGASGQTGDYWQCNNDVGTTVASMSATGNMKCNDCTAEGIVTAKNTAVCWGGQTWKSAGGASTVATMSAAGSMQCNDCTADGTVTAKNTAVCWGGQTWKSTGGASTVATMSSTGTLAVGNDFIVTGASTLNKTCFVYSGGDANKGLVVQANSSTQTGKLLDCQTSLGASVASIDPNGQANVRYLAVTNGFVNTGIGGPDLNLTGGAPAGSGADLILSSATADAAFDANLAVNGDLCHTGTFGACSDLRYKTNFREISQALDKIESLRGIYFNWKQEEFPEKRFAEGNQIGFIAQELKEVLPEAVAQDKDGYYMVDYGRLTPLLVEAMKEQQKTIENLNGKLEKLEDLVQKLLDKKIAEK